MEPMVVFALGIVVYCGSLTVKDIVTDLHQQGIMVKSLCTKASSVSFETRWGGSFAPSVGQPLYQHQPPNMFVLQARALCPLN
jgi:hypothetical protein